MAKNVFILFLFLIKFYNYFKVDNIHYMEIYLSVVFTCSRAVLKVTARSDNNCKNRKNPIGIALLSI
jgi:hypothetical protein